MFGSVSGSGLDIFVTYGKLVLLLVGSMLAVVLVVDPIILFIHLRCNPYPLIWRCVRESGVTAFFTRSSAANIPVNMELCERLGLDKDVYSVSIPSPRRRSTASGGRRGGPCRSFCKKSRGVIESPQIIRTEQKSSPSVGV